MKKILCFLAFSLLLTSCFGWSEESEVEQGSVSTGQVVEENVSDPNTETVEEPEASWEDATQEEPVQITDPEAEDENYDVRSNIESDPDAQVVEQEGTVIPTAPASDTNEAAVEPSSEDSAVGDDVVDDFENELNELFQILETDA